MLPVKFLTKFVSTIIGDEEPITCRPADLIEPELKVTVKITPKGYNGITDEDVLTTLCSQNINFFEANRR